MTFPWGLNLVGLVPPVLVGGAIVVGLRLARAREHARRARILAHLGAPASFEEVAAWPRDEEVTVEGQLALVRHDGATPDERDCVGASYHPFGASFLAEYNAYAVNQEAAGTLVVDLGGGARAVLEGPVQVLVGERETGHDTPVSTAHDLGVAIDVSDRLLRGKLRGQFRMLLQGAHVRVRGFVTPIPDDHVHYRQFGRAVRIQASTDKAHGVGAILVAAAPPSRTVHVGRRTFANLGGAVLVSVLAGVFLWLLLAPADVRAPRAPDVAALPAPPTEPACRVEVRAHLEKNAFAEAKQVAEGPGCNDAEARAMAAWATGSFGVASERFSEASDIRPSLSEAEAHLFAHRYERAAKSVRRMVSTFYPGPDTLEKQRLACIAQLLERRAAFEESKPLAHVKLGRIGAQHEGRLRPRCTARPLVVYAAELAAEQNMTFGFDDDKAPWEAVGNPFSAGVAPRARIFARPVGVERLVLDDMLVAPTASSFGAPKPGDPYGKVHTFDYSHPGEHFVRLSAMAADLVLFYAVSGMGDEARPYWPILDRIASTVERGETLDADYGAPRGAAGETFFRQRVADQTQLMQAVLSVAAAAAFFAEDDARTDRYARVGEAHSSGVVRQLKRMRAGAAWEEPIEDGHWGDHAAVFGAARSGDGARVVTTLLGQRSLGREVLPRVYPRLNTNKEALGAWLRERYPAPCTTCGAANLHGHLTDRREVARVLAASKEASELEAPVKSFVHALTDPEVAWEIDELETFFASGR